MYVELFLAVFLEKYAFSDSISSAEYALIEHGNFYFRKTFETYPSKKLNIKLKLSISFFTKYAILLGMKLIFFMKINFQNILNSFTSLFISFNSRKTTQFRWEEQQCNNQHTRLHQIWLNISASKIFLETIFQDTWVWLLFTAFVDMAESAEIGLEKWFWTPK